MRTEFRYRKIPDCDPGYKNPRGFVDHCHLQDGDMPAGLELRVFLRRKMVLHLHWQECKKIFSDDSGFYLVHLRKADLRLILLQHWGCYLEVL